ncbi:MAG: hypothetical protein OEY44_02635, partial [Candidatus Peregrinibacteria bacterium]|nr:hypothetical protein [Candidatus Peregrinibacteria bacterium]
AANAVQEAERQPWMAPQAILANIGLALVLMLTVWAFSSGEPSAPSEGNEQEIVEVADEDRPKPGDFKMPGPDAQKSIKEAAFAWAIYTRYVTFSDNESGEVFTSMKKLTDHNTARFDGYQALHALREKEEEKLLAVMKKYEGVVDFLPMYFLKISNDQLDEIRAYAQEHGAKDTLHKLLKGGDKGHEWPYVDQMNDLIREKAQEKAKLAKEVVWDRCPISTDPHLFVELSTGKVSKKLFKKLEPEESAGESRPTYRLDKKTPFLDIFGQICQFRDAYATDWELANQCVKEKTGEEIVFMYCRRSEFYTTVVRHNLQGKWGYCSRNKAEKKAKIALKLPRAVAPGSSLHDPAAAADVSKPSTEVTLACLDSPLWSAPMKKMTLGNIWRPDGHHIEANYPAYYKEMMRKEKEDEKEDAKKE